MQKTGNKMKQIAILFSLMTYLLQVEFEVALVFEFNITADFPIGIIFSLVPQNSSKAITTHPLTMAQAHNYMYSATVILFYYFCDTVRRI